jgi:hypothetical protein
MKKRHFLDYHGDIKLLSMISCKQTLSCLKGIKIGQRIRIPYVSKTEAYRQDLRIHKVGPGETMFSISKKYGCNRFSDILAWNNLQGADISVGQALIIKGVAPTYCPCNGSNYAGGGQQRKKNPCCTYNRLQHQLKLCQNQKLEVASKR